MKKTSVTVSSRDEAWKAVEDFFPACDQFKDTYLSERAGYPIYASTLPGDLSYVSDLCSRLEINLANGETINIWIDEAAAEDTAKAEAAQNAAAPFSEIGRAWYAEDITTEAYHCKPNMSAIYTKLIQEAGRICERWASDILIGIGAVEKWLDMPHDSGEGKSWCFGFRKDGVDHYGFIACREKRDYYKLYRLDAAVIDGEIRFRLYEAEKK